MNGEQQTDVYCPPPFCNMYRQFHRNSRQSQRAPASQSASQSIQSVSWPGFEQVSCTTHVGSATSRAILPNNVNCHKRGNIKSHTLITIPSIFSYILIQGAAERRPLLGKLIKKIRQMFFFYFCKVHRMPFYINVFWSNINQVAALNIDTLM